MGAEGLDDPAVPAALGRYLLGVRAGAVQLDARLSDKYMLGGVTGHEEIVASVRRVVGETNVFETDAEKAFRNRMRNAWISRTRCWLSQSRRDGMPDRPRRRYLQARRHRPAAQVTTSA